MYLPEADSGRLVVGTWWLVVLVVVTTYCGNLVAFLTFPRQEAPITTVRELLQHSGTITWSLKKNSYLQEALQVFVLNHFFDIFKRFPIFKNKIFRKLMNKNIDNYILEPF